MEVEVGIDEMIAGNPKRAMMEVEMRSRLEAVRSEVDDVLKMHGSMAKGERKSWLKQIERQNEENAYQVGALSVLRGGRGRGPRTQNIKYHI